MFKNDLCRRCPQRELCEDDGCEAIRALDQVLNTELRAEKVELVKSLARELNIIDYEVADDLRELGERIIKAKPEELHVIHDCDVKIGYVRSYERKQSKGMTVNADCRKLNGPVTAYLPFDFIVTFYEPNMDYMTDNQRKILMLHELRHIGLGPQGLRIEPHSIEDFKDILHRFGIEWNEYNQEVPDILGGDIDGQEGRAAKAKVKAETKEKENGRKRQNMEAERAADSDSGTPAKSGRSKVKGSQI